MEVLDEEIVNIHEAKDIMKKREKEADLVYEQKICLEYLEKVCTMPLEKVREMANELSKIPILKPRYIALIINMMPDTEDEVKALFLKEVTNLKKNEIQQIIDIVKKYK